jgi:hypothetical protein
MAQQATEKPADKSAQTSDDKGVLMLATGTLVRVPAEGVQVATHHYDEELGQTVPVVSSFVLSD